MSRMKKLIEKQKKLTRFQALKSIFSSLIMTVTVVVVAVIVIPSSPAASIQDVNIFSDRVTYSVIVTDSDSAILDDTLTVTLENQFELYSSEVILGDNVGIFTDLNEDTEYTLKVLADKGFGLEVLDSETFKTYDKTGGAFTDLDLASEDGADELLYSIGYFVNDPFGEYQEIQIRYGFKYQYQEEIFDYQIVSVSKLDTEFLLGNIFDSNIEIHMFLEAVDVNSEVIELDNIVFRTPYHLYGSIYFSQISYDKIVVSIWPESPEGLDIEYELILKRNYTEIDRQTIEMSLEETDPHHSAIEIIFEGLKQNVEYTVILLATYRNPYTEVIVEEELVSEIATTLPRPDYQIEVIEFDQGFEVTITVEDLLETYDKVYHKITEVTEWGDYQYEYIEYNLEFIDDKYQYSWFIYKPSLAEYTIHIGINNGLNNNNYCVFYTYEYLEEVE